MSEYRTVPTEFCFQDELIASLEEIYGEGTVENHLIAQNLFGYKGDQRPEVANLIVRRKNVGRASNDLGFIKNDKGNYEMIVSAFDEGGHVKQQDIVAKYAHRVIKSRLPAKYRVLKAKDNEIKLQVLR